MFVFVSDGAVVMIGRERERERERGREREALQKN
jgi:hypothetical protein